MPIAPKRSVRTKVNYSSAFNRFVAFAGSKRRYTREDIEKAVEAMEASNLKPSYISYILKVARTLLGAGRFPADIKYKVSKRSLNKVRLSSSDIARLIKWARKDALPEFRFYVAMSTLYGLRRGELALISNEHIDWENGTVFVDTEKGGEEQEHFIPRSVLAQIKGTKVRPISQKTMGGIFKLSCIQSGFIPESGAGWHAIRRALVTDLLDTDIDVLKARYFLRWKRGDIMNEYIVPEGFKIDKDVFRYHPFLPYWEV
jgi:integrase